MEPIGTVSSTSRAREWQDLFVISLLFVNGSGPWYDRLNGDTPNSINARVNHQYMSFFQSDFNLTSDCQPEMIDNFLGQLDNTTTDAIAYMTIYPMQGFDAVTDAGLDCLAGKVSKGIASGRKMFIRYASEMNVFSIFQYLK